MHLIQQHTFDIQCSSQDFGKEMQDQLGMLLEKDFYPQLEKLLNKYDSKSNILSINILDIELPSVSKKYWKEELVQKSLIQIEEYLKRNQLFDSVKKSESDIDFILNSNHAEYIFFEFLKTGKIIENAITKNLEKLVYEIEVSETFIEELRSNFKKHSNCLIRWIFSTPNFFKEIVFKRLNQFPSEAKVFLDNILVINAKNDTEINSSIQKIIQNKVLKNQWIELIQWMIYLQKENISKEASVKRFVQFSEEFWEITKQELRIVCQYILDQSATSSDVIPTEVKEFFQKTKKEIPESATEENSFQAQENSSKQKDNVQFSTNIRESDFENVQYIKNAGLIILHPFLKPLFEQLDLCDVSGNWTTKVNQHKAILLTQFLVYGLEKVQESDLLLNKILCGFPMKAIVNVKLKISKKEKEKCNNLLEAVKEHWKVMNDSSVEALQQTFLQREAKVELVSDNEYEVWVEEKGYDILLEQLPWGIGMIQTPWMENYLSCHWS